MTYQREQNYRRACRELERVARRRGWDCRSPQWSLSEVRDNRILLIDQLGVIAVFKLTARDKLQLLDHDFFAVNGNGHDVE